MTFLARLVSNNFGSFEKMDLGDRPSQPPLRKNLISAQGSSFCSWLHVRFDLPSSINFRDINGFLKLGTHNPYYGVTPDGPVVGYRWIIQIWFPINCTRGRILHFDILSSCVLPSSEGLPWDDLRNILLDGQWMAKLQNGVKTLPKILTGWVGCTNVTDRLADKRSRVLVKSKKAA